MFSKKGVHRNFAKLTGKHLCQSLFFRTPPVVASDRSHIADHLNLSKGENYMIYTTTLDRLNSNYHLLK